MMKKKNKYFQNGCFYRVLEKIFCFSLNIVVQGGLPLGLMRGREEGKRGEKEPPTGPKM